MRKIILIGMCILVLIVVSGCSTLKVKYNGDKLCKSMDLDFEWETKTNENLNFYCVKIPKKVDKEFDILDYYMGEGNCTRCYV